MPLTTRCGRCGRLFPIYAQEIRLRRGRVNCPQCGSRVHGLAALVDEPMLDRAATDARARLGLGKPGADQSTHRGPGSAAPPSARPRGSTPMRVGWGLTLLALLLALPMQLAWWYRADLLRDPGNRRTLVSVCQRLGCSVPAAHLPGALSVLGPTLTPDPETGSVVLHLSMRNDAEVPQAPPLLELSLLGQQGDLLGARRFAPIEYGLPEGRPIGAGETAEARVSIRPLKPRTSGFRVRLL